MNIILNRNEARCPHCAGTIKLGLSRDAIVPGKVSVCVSCTGFIVLTSDAGLRAPTDRERVTIEASGLGPSLREDVARLRAWRETGQLPPKRVAVPKDEPVFFGDRR